MKIRAWSLSYILMLLILFAGIGSLLFSFYWINKLFRQEEQKQYNRIVRQVEESLMSIREEVDIMNIMLFISGRDFDEQDYTNFSTKLDFWLKNTEYPRLLEEVYILNPPGDDRKDKDPEFYRWDTQLKLFTVHPIPTVLSQYGQAIRNEETDRIKTLESILIETGLIFNEMQIHTSLFRNKENGGPVLFAKINMDELFTHIAPDYFNRELEEYDWTIIHPGEEIDTDADFWLTLDDELFLKHSFWTPDYKTADKLMDSRSYETFKMWMNRNRRDKWKQQISLRISPYQNRNKYYLQISMKEDSIHNQINSQRRNFLLLSFLFTFILLYSIVVLFRMNRKTQTLRKMEQDFTRSLGHELKTPLAVILSSSELVMRTNDREKLQRYGKSIRTQSLRLTSQIERLLLHARMENRLDNPVHREPVNLKGFIKEMITSMDSLIKMKEVNMQIDEESLSLTAETDREILMMILENLITNALKYGLNPSEGNILRIRAEKQTNRLSLIIEDEGKGISFIERNLVFTSYFRGRRYRKPETKGTGLGLNLSKKGAKLLKGKLEMESPYKRKDGTGSMGTSFTLTLPYNGENNEHTDS